MAKINANVREVEITKADRLMLVRLPNEDAVEVFANGRVIYYADKGATVWSNIKMGPRKKTKHG